MLANLIGFQIGWFACVLGAAYGYPLLGPLVGLPVLGLHLLWQADRSTEIMLMLAATVIGSAYDQLLLSLGLVSYSASIWNTAWLPIWMITLWVLFATTLNVSLKWMHGRYPLASLLGCIGGPLAYWGGEKLGAIQWLHPLELLIALAVGWAILMPILVRLAAHLRQAAAQKGLTHV